MNWNPSYSYATLPPTSKTHPLLPHPHHQSPRAARPPPLLQRPHLEHQSHRRQTAFEVSAYPNATLDNFRLEHLNIEAATAGTIANAKNWTLTDNTIKTADGTKVKFTDASIENPKDVPFGERK